MWEGEVWGGQMSPHQVPHGDAEEAAGGRADCGSWAWF